MRQTKQPAPGPDPYVPAHGSADLRITGYDLKLEYDVGPNRLTGVALLTGMIAAGRAGPGGTVGPDVDSLWLDLHRPLKAEEVRLRDSSGAGVPIRSFRQRHGRLEIVPARKLHRGEGFRLEIRYRGKPRPGTGPWGDIGWEELEDGVLVAGQPTGAPSWFPCNDLPTDKAAYRISVTVEAGYYVVCNGRLSSHRAGGGRETWVYEQPEPMPAYLATVQIGRYVRVDLPGEVPQSVVAHPRRAAMASAALARQDAMMQLFTACFGPYPFGSYTVVVTEDELEIPLEAQSVSVFGFNHLRPGGAGESLLAHELAHQWFGNSVTGARWSDIWLHEGCATYAEWIWAEAAGDGDADRLAAKTLKWLQRRPGDLRLADPGPEHMFDDRVYRRGALALHALRRSAGDEVFFELLQQWTQRYRHGCAGTADFLGLADEVYAAVGVNASGLLAPWLYAPAVPAAVLEP